MKSPLRLVLAVTVITAVTAASALPWSSPARAAVELRAHVEGVMCVLGATTVGYEPLLDQAAPPGASKDVKRLMAALCPKGCGQVGVFRNPTSPSAITVTVGSRASKVAYKGAFLEAAERTYGAGAALGILAHEVGHHVDANAPAADWMVPRWGTELRADAWAGCALAKINGKIGGKTGDVKAAIQALATYPSPSHPAWTERAVVLQKGYRSCGGTMLAELEPRPPGSGASRGCAEDRECKIGRVCFDGRCQEAALRRACAKDVDCPGQQICAGAGICVAPQAPRSAPGSTPAAVVVASIVVERRRMPRSLRGRSGDVQRGHRPDLAGMQGRLDRRPALQGLHLSPVAGGAPRLLPVLQRHLRQGQGLRIRARAGGHHVPVGGRSLRLRLQLSAVAVGGGARQNSWPIARRSGKMRPRPVRDCGWSSALP
jgi:hypothetical protein